MATLSTIFKLFDGYSTTVDKINKKTDAATNKILKASGATDKFNNKLKATGASANTASSGLGKFLSVAALVTGALKGMSITDEYINTSARLKLINKDLRTQAELQNKIFAAADRARGSYSDMAAAVAKMGMLAGDAFDSNDETIAFTELMQKSFRVGGASAQEQQAGMYQLTQAMASGRLQGDEFRSIRETAPMLIDAIAKYTGKSKGELKEMSAQGTITADIIKNSMFMAGEDINDMFETLPMTFSDVWNKIKNSGTKAFAGVMEKINKLINTDGFASFINKISIGFELTAQAASWAIDTIINGWDTIGPILKLIGGALLISIIAKLWATVPPLVAQAAAWLAMYWPLLLIIGVIAIIISAARQLGASWEQIFGVIGGIVGLFVTSFYNEFVKLWNTVAAFVNFFGNVFTHPVASTKALFCDLTSTVIGYIGTMAQGIEDIINKIPGVEVDITGGLDGLKSKLENASATIKSEAGLVEYVKTKDFMDYSEGYTKGSDMGKTVLNNLDTAINTLTESISDKSDWSNFGDDPTTVNGTGTNGAVDVDMSDEDLKYLRDIAEREYVNKFSTATLAPNIKISFGDVHEEADVNKVAKRIEKILQEGIAVAAEGAY
ncbi:MAG: tape measure protein [Clostridia bacterium]|nr:tape measure protein [Clostridia bacterium]MDD4027316.1 tape measure protein [Candidatus Shapirobacteria bacterium]